MYASKTHPECYAGSDKIVNAPSDKVNTTVTINPRKKGSSAEDINEDIFR